jgi:hypothetical protein
MEIPKHYSLVEDNKSHFIIHDKRDGKQFPIAKQDLHPAHQIKLMKIKKFDEGGEAEEADAAPPQEETLQAPAQDIGGVGDIASQSPQGLPPQIGFQAPELPQSQQGPGDAGVQAGTQPQQGQQFVGPGMDEQLKGIRAQAGGAQQLARDQQKALEDHQNNLKALQVEHANNYAQLELEQNHYQQQLESGKINPNRYYENMDTGKRIRTAIGLILGGIGSGLTHGPNVALQLMNKAVDDDIMSQKADIGKTQNLLSINLQKYHRMDMAEAATRLQYNTTLQMQLQAAASKSTSASAQAALHMQMGQLQQQNYAFKNTMALNMAKAQNLGFGGGEGGTPEGQENFQMLNDPKYQEKRVMVNGRAFQASDKDAADKMRRTEAIAGPVASQIRDLQLLASDPSTKFAGTASNLKAHGIMGNLSVQLPQLTGLTRVNEVEINHLAKSFQDPTRFDQSLGADKNTQFLKTLEDDLESKRSANLIGYKGMGAVKSFSPSTGKLPMNRK